MNKTDPQPAELLAGAGLRRTPIRLAVLAILSRDRQPQSAAGIIELLPAGIDKVTLYRTLNTFTRKKLVHRVRGDDQVWLYGIGTADRAARHGHAHFVCDECGTVECLTDRPRAEPAARRAKLRPGYRVEYSEVLVHGTCPDCQR
jgi:Fur family ferric uptake transcriptional regulator